MGDIPKIGVGIGDGAQPCVLQLFQAPISCEFLPTGSKSRAVWFSGGRARGGGSIEQGSVGIENGGGDGHGVAPFKGSLAWSGEKGNGFS